jgi:hypothetical protein
MFLSYVRCLRADSHDYVISYHIQCQARYVPSTHPASDFGRGPIRFGLEMEVIMSQEDKQVIATLAAAIVVTRGAKSIVEIRDAWTDATWIISPAPTNSRYKLWQEKHGEVPSTPEEDKQKAQKGSEARTAAVRHLAGRLAR